MKPTFNNFHRLCGHRQEDNVLCQSNTATISVSRYRSVKHWPRKTHKKRGFLMLYQVPKEKAAKISLTPYNDFPHMYNNGQNDEFPVNKIWTIFEFNRKWSFAVLDVHVTISLFTLPSRKLG